MIRNFFSKKLASALVVVSLIMVFAIFPSLMMAQGNTDGAIGGTVSDPSGAVVPGATITARNIETNATGTATSDSSGGYRIVRLQPGRYELQVGAGNFAGFKQTGITVEVGLVTKVDPKLGVAGKTESVDVSTEAPTVNTEQQDFNTNVNQKSINELPINGRRWSNFALLTPGANPDGGFGLISFRGISGLLNNNTVDGTDNNQYFFSEEKGRTRISYVVSQSSVQEFQVNTSNYSSEYGRAAGGVVNSVTKSGTNTYHGQAFFYDRDSQWGATNPFTILTTLNNGVVTRQNFQPTDKRFQYGGNLGGALIKDKLFFFFNYDQQHRNFPGLATVTQNPDFFFSPAPGAVPAGETCNANGTLTPTLSGATNTPSNAAAASACLIASRYKTTYANGVTNYNNGLAYLISLTGPVPRTGDQVIVFPKLDWKINQKNTFSASFNRLRWDSPAGIQTQPFNTRGRTNFGNDFVKADTIIGKLDTFITSNLSNQVRYQFGRDFEFENSQIPAPNEPRTANGLPPQATINGSFQGGCSSQFCVGKPEFLDRAALPDEHRHQIADTMTWIHGKHLFKYGFDYNHVNDLSSNLRFEAGSFNYNNEVDFISDFGNAAGGCLNAAGTTRQPCYTQFTQAFGPTTFSFNTNDYAFFFQDDWKIAPHLTLNLGIRYEYEQLPTPQIPNPGFPATAKFPGDKNNIGPRLGFAWQPYSGGKTVIRGGYGFYYGRILNGTVFSALSSTGVTAGQVSYQFGPTTAGAPLYPNVLATAPAASTIKPNSFGFDTGFQNPSIQQADLIFEHEFGWNTVFSASWLLSVGSHLPNAIDTNLPAPTTISYRVVGGSLDGQTVISPFYTGARPDVNFTNKTLIISQSRSNYNALVFQFNKRFSSNIQFQNNYTWSHAIDENQNTGNNPTNIGYLDPNNTSLERGSSDFDIRHKFVSSVIWQPKWTVGNSLLSTLVNGFTIAPIVSITGGRPLNGSVSGTPTGASVSGISGSGGPSRIPTMRNTFRFPTTNTVDLRLSRRFAIAERFHLELLGEAFNLFNHQNVTSEGGTRYTIGNVTVAAPVPSACANQFSAGAFPAGSSVLCSGLANSFGTVTGTNGNTIFRERQVQMAIRFEF